MTLKPTETKTQWLKNQPKQNISEKPNRFLANFRSNTSARLQLSAVILTIRNWHHIVQTSGNLNFSSTLEMHVFRQNTQLVAVYKRYGSVQRYLETPRHPWFHQTFVMKLLTNIAFTHCSSVLSWNISLVNTRCCRTIVQGAKKQFTLNMLAI